MADTDACLNTDHEKLVKKPRRYDFATDEMVEVTQEWVDQMGALLQALGSARRAAKRALVVEDGIVKMTHPALQEFLDAWKPEFEQKL